MLYIALSGGFCHAVTEPLFTPVSEVEEGEEEEEEEEKEEGEDEKEAELDGAEEPWLSALSEAKMVDGSTVPTTRSS